MEISINGNLYWLLPEKAVFWREKKYLIVSDLHLGKSSFFRSRGIAAPSGPDENDLNRLKIIIKTSKPNAIIILGDLVHAACTDVPAVLAKFNEAVEGTEIVYIRGNHDRILKKYGYTMHDFFYEDEFVFAHEPFEDESKYVFAGHLHPSVLLTGRGRSSEKIPCFFFGKKFALLPSFGSFTGNYLINPAEGERVFIPVDEDIIEVFRKK